MSSSHGRFVWYELMTTDTTAAEAFYRGVMGWKAQDSGMPDMRYTILSVGDIPMGGLMALPEEARAAGARPAWIGYIAVDDVDATAARVTEAGGAVHHGPDDIPGVGRFAVVADPHGAVFTLFRSTVEGPPPVPCGTLGHAGWRELYAKDGAAAFGFYADLFGWTKTEAFDMGPMGVYQLFATDDGTASGGMMTKPETVPAPFWLYYFAVDNIDSAMERVQSGGGQILNGPMEVPGGQWIIQCLDPQGVMFALVGPRV